VAAGTPTNDDDVLLAVGPLALRAQQLIARVEDEVVAAAFDDRPPHSDAELDSGSSDLCLCNRPFGLVVSTTRTPVRAAYRNRCISRCR
jgi:hypothetical protein